MLAAEKAVIRRKWARMDGFKLDMSRICDNFGLVSCICTPKQENYGSVLIVELSDNAIGEELPAHTLVAIGFMRSDGKNAVQKKYALLRPCGQVSVIGYDETNVALKLLIYITLLYAFDTDGI